jgi:hypothetical protein
MISGTLGVVPTHNEGLQTALRCFRQAFLLTYTSGLYHVNSRPQHSPPHFAAGPLVVLTKFTAN